MLFLTPLSPLRSGQVGVALPPPQPCTLHSSWCCSHLMLFTPFAGVQYPPHPRHSLCSATSPSPVGTAHCRFVVSSLLHPLPYSPGVSSANLPLLTHVPSCLPEGHVRTLCDLEPSHLPALTGHEKPQVFKGVGLVGFQPHPASLYPPSLLTLWGQLTAWLFSFPLQWHSDPLVGSACPATLHPEVRVSGQQAP